MSKLKGIFKAAAYGNITKVKEYIAAGINLNEGDEVGYTTLHWAIQEGYLEIVKLLIMALFVNIVDNCKLITKRMRHDLNLD